MRRALLALLLAVLGALGGWTLFQQYRERAKNAVEQEHENEWNPLFQQAQAGVYHYRCDEAEPVLQTMLPKAEEWWPHGPQLESVLIMLGECYRGDRNYDMAEPLLTRALNFGDTSDPIRLARVKINLGVIARDQGRYEQAEQYFSEALAVDEKKSFSAQADDAMAMLNLGLLRQMRGNYAEGEAFYTRAIAVYERDLGSKPFSDLAFAYYSLGESYARENRPADAAVQYQKAAAMYEQLGDPNRLDAAHALDELASMEYLLGHTAQSREIAQYSERIKTELASASSPADCRTLYSLGIDADGRHKLKEAESFYKKSIAACEQTLSPDDPQLARPLSELADLYRDNDGFDMSLAAPLYQRALALREKAFGPDNSLTAEVLSNQALLYFFLKNPTAGEQVAQRALVIQEKQFGPENLAVSTTLNRLGLCQRDLGKFQESEVALKRALAIREKLLPANAHWLIISLQNLATLYEVENQPEKAEPLIARAHAIELQSAPR